MVKQYICFVGLLIAILGLSCVSAQEEPHPCERQCVLGEPPMVCEYDFTVEWYVTLSKACYECPFNLTDCDRPHCVVGDGQRRKVITVNRQYPGPKIEVCENDTVIVHVANELGNGEGTIIHWHGMEMRGTNWADGAGRLTQCPIPQFNEFTYEFLAYPSGTFVWHAHYGKQRADGLSGALVVQEPQEMNPHYDLYDHNCDTPSGDCEFVKFLSEWMAPDYMFLSARVEHYSALVDTGRNTALINGRMQYYDATNVLHPGETALTPYSVFTVQQGKSYRIRLIGFSVECGYEWSVEGHTLTVMSADGYYVEPVDVDVIALMPGERYDYILHADQPVGNYWIKSTTTLCGNGYAILRYEGAPEADPEGDVNEGRDGVVLNPLYPINDSPDRTLIRAVELNSTTDEDWTDEVVDEVHFITMKIVFNDKTHAHHPIYYPLDDIATPFRVPQPVFNNISFTDPKSPLLTQFDDVDPDSFCNSSTINHAECYETRCYCTNVEKVALGSVVDFIFVNFGQPVTFFGHPIHMHGYHYRIMSQMELGDETHYDEVVKLYLNGQIPMKLRNPSYRDTVVTPSAGITVARIRADNPGYWLFHCHVDEHADAGQMMVIQVGERDEMTPAPEDMPRCGDWAPSSGLNNKGAAPAAQIKDQGETHKEAHSQEEEVAAGNPKIQKLYEHFNQV